MRHPSQSRIGQRGYSIVELSVAVVIALFLLTGLFSILQGTRNTSTNQTALAQLQDNERIAVMVMNDVIQEAGHYDNTASYTTAPNVQFPAVGTTYAAGQTVFGDTGTITVRYSQDTTGLMLDCAGRTVPTAPAVSTMQFKVVGNTLKCVTNGGTEVPIVNNVTSIAFMYGVQAAGATSISNYQTSDQLTNNQAANTHPDWTDVHSVKLTVTFPNPLAGQPGQSSNPISFVRFISIMAKNGANGHP